MRHENGPTEASCKREARRFAAGKQKVTTSDVQEFVAETWGAWVRREEKRNPRVSASEHYADLCAGVTAELRVVGVEVVDE